MTDYLLNAIIRKYKGSHPLNAVCSPIAASNGQPVSFEGTQWALSCGTQPVSGNENVFDINAAFTCVTAESKETSIGLRFDFNDWSRDNYVLLPAAAYNGNRFEAIKQIYPPQVSELSHLGANAPTIISDVPRLNIGGGASKIDQISRDLATPAIGFFAPRTKRGFWLLTGQSTALGDTGICIEESDDRSSAYITISAPGVRHDTRYNICDTSYPCTDMGYDFKQGDSVELHVRIYSFDCADIQGLFDYFVNIRKDISGKTVLHHEIPFSEAWAVQEKKYNSLNWMEVGYYAVGAREDKYEDWQIGWTGGLINTLPLIFEGSGLSKERALKTFDFVFNEGQDESGFIIGCYSDGTWFGDNFKNNDLKWLLLRKNADGLYFIIKQFMLLRSQDNSFSIPEKWFEGTRRLADAFVKLWDRFGQFGQFVDTVSGDIIVGGSASAGIAPAGLALAGQYFGNGRYTEVAEQAALYYYEKFVQNGITNGGPCEACQCPDSESAFGLLESFIVLLEVTGETKWVQKAVDIANQCFTWCVSYDFNFPEDSTFGKLDMHTTGSVYANVQNKHSAPGICTLSGNSLFKLYRATGNKLYLELIQEMAHNMPQYVSREDRFIMAENGQILPAGWVNERVQMSDWNEPIGEVFYSSTWPEISNMLTFVEIPGLYVQPDTGFFCAIDHIDVEKQRQTGDCLTLRLHNPTNFDANVKVFSEKSTNMGEAVGQNALLGCCTLQICAHSSITADF